MNIFIRLEWKNANTILFLDHYCWISNIWIFEYIYMVQIKSCYDFKTLFENKIIHSLKEVNNYRSYVQSCNFFQYSFTHLGLCLQELVQFLQHLTSHPGQLRPFPPGHGDGYGHSLELAIQIWQIFWGKQNKISILNEACSTTKWTFLEMFENTLYWGWFARIEIWDCIQVLHCCRLFSS